MAERIAAARPLIRPSATRDVIPAQAGIHPRREVGPRLRGGDGEERAALPLDESLAISKQIADALEYAHEHNIIHRDLKPANVSTIAYFRLTSGLRQAGEWQANSSPALKGTSRGLPQFASLRDNKVRNQR